MKFRFCGDLDCPDWVLAEISVLSKLSSIKVKMLCIQAMKSLLHETVDQDKIMKMASDAKFELDDMKACMAVLTLILINGTKYGVDGNSLSNELQQLGMPKASTLVSFDWRIDHVISSSLLNDVNQPYIRLKIVIKDPTSNKTNSSSFSLTYEKFLVFLAEMKQAKAIIENL